jgi:UDP-GlcNAc:undecaprenyl-phosphate GlcNAc-1-phosphate transferase
MNGMAIVQSALVFLFSCLSSWFVVGIMRKIAIRFQVLDHPNSLRKNQKNPVPYLGGIAIIISILISLIVGLIFLPVSKQTAQEIWFLMLPCLIIGVVGLWDDLRELSPQFRLMMQVLLGLFCSASISFGSTTGSATGNQNLDTALTIFWIVGVTNAFNFFDNFDGGAAVASITAAFGISVISFTSGQTYLGSFGIVIIGTLMGFFYWNKNPARIYMGDAGALFLGMLLATLSIRTEPSTQTGISSFAIPILLLALPILDTCVVVFTRLRAKRSPFLGGRDHLSHRLLTLGLSHQGILIVFALIASYFQLFAFSLLLSDKFTANILIGSAACSLVFLFILFSRKRIDYES